MAIKYKCQAHSMYRPNYLLLYITGSIALTIIIVYTLIILIIVELIMTTTTK